MQRDCGYSAQRKKGLDARHTRIQLDAGTTAGNAAKVAMRKMKDLQNQRFGKWIVIEFAGKSTYGHILWRCKCDCGNVAIIYSFTLLNGTTNNCGCIRVTHGKSKTRIYGRWLTMKNRCLNSNYLGFKDYGGRGITVCQRWKKFENFYSDMGEPPVGRSLERRDNNGSYSPENCYWATREEQANNTRTSRTLTFNGETHNLGQWAKKIGMKTSTLCERLNRYQWSIEKALMTPVQARIIRVEPPLETL